MTDPNRVQLYLSAGVKYVVAFFPKETYAEGHTELFEQLAKDPVQQQQFESLYSVLVGELLSTERITGLIKLYPALAISFFEDFSEIALGETAPRYNVDLAKEIDKVCPKPQDRLILKTFLTFNASILLTNYFKKEFDPGAVAFASTLVLY